MEKNLNFYRFNILNLAYSLIVIGWGAFVRASGSGAGCGAHWPLCNGEVIPTSQRLQTLIEFTHRGSSGISIALVAIGFFWARRLAEKGSPIRKAAGLTAIAIVLEALLGAGLVLLRLVEFDQSALRAFSISLHSVNTLFLLGSIATLTFFSKSPEAYLRKPSRLFPRDRLFIFTLCAFLALAVSGAVTALGDTLFPSTNLMSGMNEDFRAGAHFLV
ncbi:MAG: COX15/CtaA family protein, partial [Bdellovibrionales bacterium]|nr:COX15/CtaA family protein [Oligoflexia bacterium]